MAAPAQINTLLIIAILFYVSPTFIIEFGCPVGKKRRKISKYLTASLE
jgi:hypothetical protein